MEPLAPSREFPVYVDAPAASEGLSEAREDSGLGALLIVLTPFALAAWLAIGLAISRAVT